MVKRIAMIALVLAMAFALTACGQSKAQIEAANKDLCFSHMRQIRMAMDVIYADSDEYPSVTDAAAKLGFTCPDGGKYSFDPNTNTVSCSIHGHE